jgi:hypothetical protein
MRSRLDHFLCLDGRLLGSDTLPWLPNRIYLRRRGSMLLLWSMILIGFGLFSEKAMTRELVDQNSKVKAVRSLTQAKEFMKSVPLVLSPSSTSTSVEVSSKGAVRSLGRQSEGRDSQLKGGGDRGRGSYDWVERLPFQSRE